MYRKIVTGYDGSGQANDAVALGRRMAKAIGAELVLGGVAEYDALIPPAGIGVAPPPSAETLALMRRVVEAELAEPAERVAAEPLAVVSSSAARGLEEIADQTEADLIVVGSCHHGRTGRILAGSVGQRLLHSSRRAVTVAPLGYAGPGGAEGLSTVAVGFDGGGESEQALRAATALAKAAGATLRLVAVVRHEPVIYGNGLGIGIAVDLEEATKASLESRLDEALGQVSREVPAEARVVRGDPHQVLGSLDVDLLVVGSRRYGPVRSVLLGGLSLALMRTSTAPVLVVPRGADVPEAAPA